ncbi:retrovirus-related pol polyprotein from transposon TNT 1-94 [Tanacetum coccineum]
MKICRHFAQPTYCLLATPQQNSVVEIRNRTLVEASRTMLIFSKAPLFLWAEAINTACYTQNHSLICLRYNKTLYEPMHDKKPNLLFLCVFGSLFYPTNDSEDLGKLNAKADIGILVGYAPAKKAFRIYNRRTRKIMETIHVTNVPNPIPQQPCNPPNRDDWDRLFEPMFDEYFNPPPSVISPILVAVAPRAVDIADSPMSTSIDQDAPSIKPQKEVYVSQPEGFVDQDNPSHVYKLKKALYGLKQAPRAWQVYRTHLHTVKGIFRYLKGTINIGLWYSKDTDMSLTAYSNADHARCQDTRRGTSRSAQFLGDKLVSWSSKKQKSTAISSTESEYIVLKLAFVSKSLWIDTANRLWFTFKRILLY